MVITRRIDLQSNPNENEDNVAVTNITPEIQQLVETTKITSGTVTVFVPATTAGITTIEFEPGLVEDFRNAWARLIPNNIFYKHEYRWNENNGFSHVRAAMLGPSLVVPVSGKRLTLGQFQQIVFVDFDNRPRSRQIILQIMGES